jgi:hypothetical protein
MSIHRYVWNSLNLGRLNAVLPQSAGATIAAEGPRRVLDVALADDLALPDLHDALAELGWTFVESNPTTPAAYLNVRQVEAVDVTVDSFVLGATFETLLSVNIETDVSVLDVRADAAVSTLVTGGFLRLVLDGTPIVGSGASVSLLGTFGLATSRRVAVSAGPHVIALEWRAALGGTLRCRPVSLPDAEHASLYVADIS